LGTVTRTAVPGGTGSFSMAVLSRLQSSTFTSQNRNGFAVVFLPAIVKSIFGGGGDGSGADEQPASTSNDTAASR
jgi:hypothetical protein